jgi:hypothetical protein
MAITIANPKRRSVLEMASIQRSFRLFWDLTIRIVVITCPFSSIGTVIKTPADGHWQQFISRQQSDLHLVASFQVTEYPAMLPKTPYVELLFFDLRISSLI